MHRVRKGDADAATEQARCRLTVTDDDFLGARYITGQPDAILLGPRSSRGQDLIRFIRRMDDGTTFYLEEVRVGRGQLALTSMRKFSAAREVDAIARTMPSYARSDGEAEEFQCAYSSQGAPPSATLPRVEVWYRPRPGADCSPGSAGNVRNHC